MSDRTKIKITAMGNDEDLDDFSNRIGDRLLFEHGYMIGINDFDADDGILIVTFHTRWAPPFNMFDYFKDRFPNLRFIFQWREEPDGYENICTYRQDRHLNEQK